MSFGNVKYCRPVIRSDHLFVCQPSQDLLDPARWKMLIQQFRYDNYRLHQLGNNSVFTITLQAGLSAIKTPYLFWSLLCAP